MVTVAARCLSRLLALGGNVEASVAEELGPDTALGAVMGGVGRVAAVAFGLDFLASMRAFCCCFKERADRTWMIISEHSVGCGHVVDAPDRRSACEARLEASLGH